MGVAKAAQNLLRVVADDRDLYSLLFEGLARLLQLHELATTVGSPIGASSENQKKSRGAAKILELSLVAGLIRKREVRYSFPHPKARGCAIVLRFNKLLEFARCDLPASAHFLQDFR